MRFPQILGRARRRRWTLFLVVGLMATACGKGTTSSGPPKTAPELKLAVLQAVGGRLDYCDPDLYPLPHGSAIENAKARLRAIEADRAAFLAILKREGLTPGQRFSDDQLIAINDDYKQMVAIQLQPDGDLYRFDVLVPKASSPTGNEEITGTVSRSGAVNIEHRGTGRHLACPICLAAGVRIATPFGDVPVQDVRVGMPVWTTDASGHRILGVVLRVGSMQAPLGHEVLRVVLADGRTVVASPGHPTAGGMALRSLRAGDVLDGRRIVSVTPIGYAGGSTYDLLPSGPTGTYFAGGVLLGSTLAR